MATTQTAQFTLVGESSKALTYLRDIWGLPNREIVRKTFIDYCEREGIYEAIKHQKR